MGVKGANINHEQNQCFPVCVYIYIYCIRFVLTLACLPFVVEEPDCTGDPLLYGNSTLPRCPTAVSRYVVPILMGFYVLFCNILLLNLLIAMFR